MEKEKTDQNLVENKSNEGKTDQNLVKNQLNGRRMKDSGVEWIGEIPEDWELKRVKHLASFVNGYAFSNDELNLEGVYPVIKIGDIKNESVDLCNANRIMSNEGLEQYKVKNKDILIAMSGATVGKLAFIDYEIEECYINQRVGIIRSNNKFLYYVLNTNEFVEYVILMSNSSAQPNISTGLIGNYPVALPNVNEQQRIADYLDSKCSKIDFIIEKQEAVIEKLQAYKQSLITEAVTKGLDADVEMKDSGIDFIGLVPASWKVCRLRNVGKCQNGISKGAEYFGKGYPFVSYGDVYRNYSLPMQVSGLVESTLEERNIYSVEAGDIFFTRTSETIEEVGFSAVCEKTISNATFAGFVIRVRPFNDEILIGFAKYYFRSNHHRLYLVKEMNLVTRASLSQELLKSMPVLLPPLEEQQQIADFLDSKCSSIDASISKKKLLIEKLKAYKKSLIYEVVTGKKEVN